MRLHKIIDNMSVLRLGLRYSNKGKEDGRRVGFDAKSDIGHPSHQ
jgi:hypothetical protein